MNVQKISMLLDNVRASYKNRSSMSNRNIDNKQDENQISVSDKDFINYLKSKLSTTYKNFFPFSEPKDLGAYLSAEGVPVERDSVGEPRLYVSIQSYPLRIVLSNPEIGYKKIAWVLNGSNQ